MHWWWALGGASVATGLWAWALMLKEANDEFESLFHIRDDTWVPYGYINVNKIDDVAKEVNRLHMENEVRRKQKLRERRHREMCMDGDY